MNFDAPVTAAEAAALLGIDRHVIYMWRGKLKVVGRRGRSPLYRWGDVVARERATRQSPQSSRSRRQAGRSEPLGRLAAAA